MNLSFSSPSTLEFLYRITSHLSRINDWIVLYPKNESLVFYSTSSCSCLFSTYTVNSSIFDEYTTNSNSTSYKIHGKALLNLLKPKNFISIQFKIIGDSLVIKSVFQTQRISSILFYEKTVPSLAYYSKIGCNRISFGNTTSQIFGYFKKNDLIMETLQDEIRFSSFSFGNLDCTELKTQLTLKYSDLQDLEIIQNSKIILSSRNLKVIY